MRHGVYRIQNTMNGKCYIGSAANSRGFAHRWGNHRHALRNGTHHSPKLQAAWDKYGESAFEFEVLLYCDPDHCITFEQIALDCYCPEYNICQIAKSMRGYKHTKEARIKIGMAHRGSRNNTAKLTQANVNRIRMQLAKGESQRAIAKTFGVSQGTISQINTGITWSEK